jgi:hypothetical protein
MNIYLRNFLICGLIFIAMEIIFKWGYGEISTFPQWVVFSISYIGMSVGVSLTTDIFSGRN